MHLTQPFPLKSPHYGYRPECLAIPAVSIITPYYNAGPLFLETVQSVLLQSLQQWEWIIVNDGSDDPAALQRLLPLRNAAGRIIVIDASHRGPAVARNAGVAAGRAPLLFFLDSGTLLAPTALEKLAWTLVSHPHSAFAAGEVANPQSAYQTGLRGLDARYAFPHDPMPATQPMMRRAVFEQLDGFDEQGRAGTEGYEFWVRAAARGYWGHDVHEQLIWPGHMARQAAISGIQAARAELRARHPRIFQDGPPAVAVDQSWLDPHALIQSQLPFTNHLQRPPGQRRILLLIPWVGVGGVDSWAIDLAAYLTAHGDRVSVCTTQPANNSRMGDLLDATADVFNLAAFLQPADYPRFLHYLIVSRQITTIMLCNSPLGYRLLPYLRAHCPGISVVDYLHMEEQHRSGGFPRMGIEHDALIDLHITSSQHLRGWMIEQGVAPERVALCPTNIDTRRWSPDPALRNKVRAELGLPDHLPVIVFIGRLVPQKRPRLVAAILKRLRHSGARFCCVIAGDGEDRAWLHWFIRRHSLRDHVCLLGPVSNARVRDLLAAADLLLLPSQHEGIAITLYEAMAMGVVPVAADVGGQRELVTSECGILVPHGDNELDQYIYALRYLIDNPEVRVRMGQAGRAHVVRHFGIEQMIDRMHGLLDQAAGTMRPNVDTGVALAAATLTIEHYQLENRLRSLPPVRALLAFRRSSAWRLLVGLPRLRNLAERSNRSLYATQQELVQGLRSTWKRLRHR